jgi:hypothetical protein
MVMGSLYLRRRGKGKMGELRAEGRVREEE